MFDYGAAPVLKGIFVGPGREELSAPGVPVYAMPRGELSCGELGEILRSHGLKPTEALLLTPTDAGIRAANALSVAVAAYVDAAFPGQGYEGTPLLIEGFDEMDGEALLRIFQRKHNIPWTIVRTERCVIRELALSDVGDLFELYDRPGLVCRMGPGGECLPGYIEPLYPFEEELEYQKNYIPYMYHFNGYGLWLVFDRESHALIGRAGIENREYPEGVEMELGYLIHPDWQRRGLATEVCTAIISYAKNHLECDRLNLLTDGENLPSVALAERLGFVYVGDTDISGSVTRRYVLAL